MITVSLHDVREGQYAPAFEAESHDAARAKLAVGQAVLNRKIIWAEAPLDFPEFVLIKVMLEGEPSGVVRRFMVPK